MLKHLSFRVSSLTSYNPWLAKLTNLNNERKQLKRAKRWPILKLFIAIMLILTKIIKKMTVPSCLLKNKA